jgi:quercetin dioxygenase-like cupin family protein
MAKFSAINLAEVEPADGYAVDREVTGVLSSRKLSPDGFSLWLVVSELDDNAEMHWSDAHGDEAVCVLQGELVVGDRICPTGGAVIVEAGARCVARANGRTVIAHYAPVAADPPSEGPYGAPARASQDDGVHVVGPNGWYRSGGGEFNTALWWADSRCETCRVSVFRVESAGADLRGVPHHHTQDEIIYLLSGSVRMGARIYGPGTALSIPAHMRYALGGDGNPRVFLNYRRDASWVVLTDDSPPVLESGTTFDGALVGDFR